MKKTSKPKPAAKKSEAKPKQKPEDTLTQEEMVKGSASLGDAIKEMDPIPPPPGVDPLTTPEVSDPDSDASPPDDSVEE